MLKPLQIDHLHDSIFKKVLGLGGSSIVVLYKCKDAHNCNKCFVVKKMKPVTKIDKLIKNNEELRFLEKKKRKKCLNEYSIGICMDHINIIRTMDIDKETNSIYFEYSPGIDFLDYLNKNSLSLERKIYFYKQLIEGVIYIHNIGVAHRDLKLENLLINGENLKIIDFGESCVWKLNNNIIKTSGIKGTTCYIAPEEFISEYNADKVDIWSLGIILYNLIYSKMPWCIACKNDIVFSNHIKYETTDEIDPRIFKNSEYYDIFKKILKTNPEKRITVNELKELIL
jgi:protein-serine/threonine kinase